MSIFGDLDGFLADILAEDAPPLAVKLRQQIRGAHVHIDVFVGADAEHLENAGHIVVGPKQAHLLTAALAVGARAMPEKVTLLPWPFEVARP